jgi:hypothetical protein
MDPFNLLLVSVEVSVAFAGFAGIIATFQFRDRANIHRVRIAGLTYIVHVSLMMALFSVLPLLLSIFGVEDATLWAVCSGLLVIWGCCFLGYFYTVVRGSIRRKANRASFRVAYLLGVIMVLCCILNAANIVFHREPGPYLAGIVMCYSAVGVMFTQILLRPLWKAVRQQEASNASGASAG